MIQGTIQYFNEKPYGNKMLYSIKLQGDTTPYMLGDRKPSINKGDSVEFEAKEVNGRWSVDTKTLKVRQSEVVTPQRGTVQRQFGGGASKDAYWENKEKNDEKRQVTIEYQAARNAAIAAASVILQAGALKLPAKESAKFDVVYELIAELTRRFAEETKSLGVKPSPAMLEPAAEAEVEEPIGEDVWN